MKKLKNLFSHLTVKIPFLIVCLMLPVNILAVQFIINMNREMQGQIRQSVKTVLEVYAESLNNELTEIDNDLYEIMNESYISEMKKESNSLEYTNARIWLIQDMQKRLKLARNAKGFFIYVPKSNDLLFSCTNGYGDAKEEVKTYLQNYNFETQTMRGWHLLKIGDRNYVIRSGKLKGVVMGAFLSLEQIQKKIQQDIQYKDSTLCLVTELSENNLGNTVTVVKEVEKTNFYFEVRVKNISVFRKITLWRDIQIFLVLFCFLSGPIWYLLLRKSVMKPVQELNVAHYQLEIGKEDYRIQKKPDSYEMQTAFDSFNRMADNINDLRLANIKKELERQELELKNLQLQIRPHFLLNTFNLIYNLAVRGEMENIQELILYLSDYFRYLFRSGKSLELFEKELRLIEGYMKSVEIRYPGRVQILYEIDPDIYMIRIPPLLLHNFVENAIKHGIPDEGNINIVLSGEYIDGTVIFEISDDGKGMEREIAEQINAENIQTQGGNNVGILNSIKRLKFFYGEKASVHVESEKNVGTTFTIIFPYNLEVEED